MMTGRWKQKPSHYFKQSCRPRAHNVVPRSNARHGETCQTDLCLPPSSGIVIPASISAGRKLSFYSRHDEVSTIPTQRLKESCAQLPTTGSDHRLQAGN